jgi:hypothetical protein
VKFSAGNVNEGLLGAETDISLMGRREGERPGERVT